MSSSWADGLPTKLPGGEFQAKKISANGRLLVYVNNFNKYNLLSVSLLLYPTVFPSTLIGPVPVSLHTIGKAALPVFGNVTSGITEGSIQIATGQEPDAANLIRHKNTFSLVRPCFIRRVWLCAYRVIEVSIFNPAFQADVIHFSLPVANHSCCINFCRPHVLKLKLIYHLLSILLGRTPAHAIYGSIDPSIVLPVLLHLISSLAFTKVSIRFKAV